MPVRSPTYVWSRPTVVAPMSAVQVVPSIENVTFDAYCIPSTGRVTEAPATSRSGIGTGGPAYENERTGPPGSPVAMVIVEVVGESTPTKVAFALIVSGLPSG